MRTRTLSTVTLALALGLTGCPADAPTCDPECGPCQACDTSGETPVCVDMCADGMVCNADNECEAPPAATCDPTCGPCQTCDTSGDSPVCVDMCADGLVCNDNNECEAPPPEVCEPACGPCQVCDTDGDAPTCVDTCADGMVCNEAEQCEPPVEPTCEIECGPCQVCDTSGDAPTCIDTCADGMVCNEDNQCEPPPPEPLVCEPECGPCQTCTVDDGALVCVDDCGSGEVCNEMLDVCERDPAIGRFHAGFTQLQGPFATGPEVTAKCITCHEQQADDFLGSVHWNWVGSTPQLQGHTTGKEVGKKNLINNFCIAIESNEPRCSQCHAGYGYSGPTFDFSNKGNIDCLICHADMSTGYTKAPTTAGLPPTTVDLAAAAKSVGATTSKNCGFCHFFAGGGDNVKTGDLGSAMGGDIPVTTDAHLGRGLTCASCHAAGDHRIDGAGLHVPVTDGGRVSCTDCHWEENGHALAGIGNGEVLDNHALDVACETCHIPAFSRQQPTKMNWDWSTAGNRVRETESTTLPNGVVVQSYNYQKGDFIWEQAVRPSYAWYDTTPSVASIFRMTTKDAYPEGRGATDATPVELSKPLSTFNDDAALIYPFKVMTGKTPAQISTRIMLVPDLYGPGSFWAGIPAASAYTPEGVRALWTTALTNGARAAGQIGATESIADSDWTFVYTEMYMGINHEVAPPDEALGCTDCHGNAAFPFQSLGYPCADPMTDTTCSRHPAQ